MPRVSEAYRQARRDEIVAATLRVLARKGLRSLTMADIIAESGLSAGSVYSHFAHKDELIELVAARVIGVRTDLLSAEPDDEGDGEPLPPLGVVRWWLEGLERDGVPFGAALQIWGEAAADPGIRTVVQRRMSDIEDAFTIAIRRWLNATGADVAAARSLARAMLSICQGYIVRTAVLGPQDLNESLAALASVARPPG